jgi:hypothetical protein
MEILRSILTPPTLHSDLRSAPPEPAPTRFVPRGGPLDPDPVHQSHANGCLRAAGYIWCLRNFQKGQFAAENAESAEKRLGTLNSPINAVEK